MFFRTICGPGQLWYTSWSFEIARQTGEMICIDIILTENK